MAALVAGVQYGLSSRNSSENTNEKPVVIFVKFTDSAFRALEEYLKNVDRTTQKPTIQFLENKGHLSIPTQQAQSSRPQIFNFTLSPNADEGTFECLQSKGSRALESFGPPSHNMCIQAKDDVYETTRHRMAVAEEQQKKNCTKVIRPDLDDIGRKVKLTPWASGASNHSKSYQSSMSSSLSMGLSDTSSSNRIMHNPPAQHHSRVVTNNHAQKPGNPEIMRRPLRDRLIHLLALRPYKKPELLDRISRDGLSEKDRKMFTHVLSQVAKLGKDNTYHPVRGVWNDVQEDWPFYTEQDRQMLRRHKPQNLTPPGSSDTGSSGSGQSPTSTHPGSPPSVTQVAKRPGYHQSADGIESKRRRISHYHKLQSDTSGRPGSDPVVGDGYQQEDTRSQQQQPQYGGGLGGGVGGSSFGFGRPGRRPPPVDDERTYLVKNNASDLKKSINNSDKRPNININNNNYAVNDVAISKESNDVTYGGSDVVAAGRKCVSDAKSTTTTTNATYDSKFDEKGKRSDSPATVTSSQTQGDAARPKWGVDYSDTRTSYEDADTIQENTVSASDTIPDYLTEYTTITNDSQRRRYKEDFYANYEEYKKLHAIMESVTQKFSQLEANLREINDRNSQQYQKIKKQIMMEYEKNKSDKEHQEAKKKFQYLHEKLSRIKKLVSEYDSAYY